MTTLLQDEATLGEPAVVAISAALRLIRPRGTAQSPHCRRHAPGPIRKAFEKTRVRWL
jgi:hypothetical protein